MYPIVNFFQEPCHAFSMIRMKNLIFHNSKIFIVPRNDNSFIYVILFTISFNSFEMGEIIPINIDFVLATYDTDINNYVFVFMVYFHHFSYNLIILEISKIYQAKVTLSFFPKKIYLVNNAQVSTSLFNTFSDIDIHFHMGDQNN